MHILITDPSPPVYGPKWEDLRDIFRNAYHGLNAYRPWQAKERLILELEETKRRAEREIEGVRVLEERVEKVLGEVGETLKKGLDGLDAENLEGTGGGKRRREEEKVEKEERMAWAVLREELEA